MTNSKSLDEGDKSCVAQKILHDDRLEKEKPSSDIVDKSKGKSDARTTKNKQDPKKLLSKSRAADKKKDPDIGKPKVQTRSKAKTLKKTQSPTAAAVGSSNKHGKNKTNSTAEVLSPNHSITEYFSCMDLKENAKNVDAKTDDTRQDTTKAQVLKEENKKSQTTSRSLRRPVAKKTDLGSHKLTEYFPVRKSDRKIKKDVELEKQLDLERKILNETEDGLAIEEFKEKGRGIVTTKEFRKDDFVIEYIGELIDRTTAEKRELQYAKDKNVGCYMYYFKHKDHYYCIDATKESGKLGRLINHSRKGNLVSRIIQVHELPRLVLFAKTDIPIGTELLYDYGDRNQESIKNNPWLNL